MAMVLRLPDEERDALARYAAQHQLSQHEVVRQAVLDKVTRAPAHTLEVARQVISEDSELLERLRLQ